MSDDPRHEDPSPFNALPPVVVALFGAMFVIEAVFSAGEAGVLGGADAVGWRLAALQEYGFSPPLFWWMAETGEWLWRDVLRIVTYPFLHYGFTQMLFAGVILLAIGKMVGEVMGPGVVAAIFVGATLAGALVFALAFPEAPLLVGGFPPTYGLIGGYTFILWVRAKATGQNPSNAFLMIALLMGIQLVFGLLFGSDNTWVADLAGFCAGFGLCFVLVPRVRAALLERLRRRR